MIWLGPFVDFQTESDLTAFCEALKFNDCYFVQQLRLYDDDRAGDEVEMWHQDGRDHARYWPYILLWASANPTQIQLPNGQIFAAAPGQLVLIKNTEVLHRRPLGVAPRRFVRIAFRESYPLDEIQRRLGLRLIQP